MKRGITILSAAALTLAMAGPVRAQHFAPNAVENTDNYLNRHPEVAERLAKDPRLVDNQGFIDSHPGLHEYLQHHPRARREFRHHPYKFMHSAESHR